MRLGIMQPYLFPYLGYFQLLNAVDQFVLYDNIEYTKKGWINRNRILLNGEPHVFSLPIKKDSDFLNVDQRFIAENAHKEIGRILGQIKSAYSKAPCFKEVFPLVEQIFTYEEKNLFNFIFNSIRKINSYLSIPTPLVVSSHIGIDHTLRSKDKVISICKNLAADTYINPIGGLELYDKEEFARNGITIQFHSMNDVYYEQRSDPFVKSLSIIDVMMFNSRDQIGALLRDYTLV